jgi:hypothetical protein
MYTLGGTSLARVPCKIAYDFNRLKEEKDLHGVSSHCSTIGTIVRSRKDKRRLCSSYIAQGIP